MKDSGLERRYFSGPAPVCWECGGRLARATSGPHSGLLVGAVVEVVGAERIVHAACAVTAGATFVDGRVRANGGDGDHRTARARRLDEIAEAVK